MWKKFKGARAKQLAARFALDTTPAQTHSNRHGNHQECIDCDAREKILLLKETEATDERREENGQDEGR